MNSHKIARPLALLGTAGDRFLRENRRKCLILLSPSKGLLFFSAPGRVGRLGDGEGCKALFSFVDEGLVADQLTTQRARLTALIEPVVMSLGLELVDVEWVPGRREGLLRVFIDTLADAGRHVGVDDCEKVSRAVSALLDVEDPIPGAFSLEVSSPGFDRVLRSRAHYERFVGSRVKVELVAARDGRRRYTGTLRAVRESGIELEVDGQTVAIPMAEIGKSRLAM
jgi:ribosome maturation factor RimP